MQTKTKILLLILMHCLLSIACKKTVSPGTATLTAVKDTGATFSENPQVELVLEIKERVG